MNCNQWEVVTVPFPFTEKLRTKRRPALVLSKKVFNENGHSLLLMITTKAHSPWPGDTNLEAYRAAGLQTACIVRLKAFTLDNRLILKKLGTISAADHQKIAKHLRAYVF